MESWSIKFDVFCCKLWNFVKYQKVLERIKKYIPAEIVDVQLYVKLKEISCRNVMSKK